MLTFYGRRSSDSVQKALWMLGETGQPFEHIELGGKFGGLDDPKFLKLNPHGRVPVLCDGDTVVWESNAIVRYLAATYSAGDLWPEEPGPRAYADQWMEWAQTGLYPDFNRLFWLTVRTPAADQDRREIAATIERVNRCYHFLNNQLSTRPHVAGDGLTIADIPSGATLYRYYNMPIDRPKMQHIANWYDRLCARDDYRKYVMVPFDELRGRLAY